MPDVSSSERIMDILDELAAIFEKFEFGTQTIVCGDFNGDVGQFFGCHGNLVANKQGLEVSAFMKKYNLFPVNTSGRTEGPYHTFNGLYNSCTIDYTRIPNNLVPCTGIGCIGCTGVIDEGELNT